jgi:hypothetical protein
MSDVAALVYGTGGGPAARAAAGAVAEVLEVPSLSELTAAARRASAPFVWVLWSRAEPAGDALAALRGHGDGPRVSLPVGRDGGPVEALVGRVADGDAGRILDGVAARTLPLRHAPVISMLLPRAAVIDAAPPEPGRFGPYAGSVWTARLFAREPGTLVTGSAVRVDDLPAVSLRHAVRTARSGAWRRGEAAREVAHALARRPHQ